jgi:O-antigen/teichoic acid export membrane protein
VDHDAASRLLRLQAIFLQGTKLSLATVIPIGGALMLMATPLVHAWVGPAFAGSVIVIQLLTITVIVRVGSATAHTVLKGAGQHRLVAYTTIIASVINLSLSIAFVRSMGLAGVALGTLIPVTASSLLVLFPAGARRVRVSIARALVEAVWPAVWPAAVMIAFVVATRDLIGASLIAVGVEMAAAAIVYAATFLLFGIRAVERRFYLSKALELTGGWRLSPSPVSEGA